MPTTADIRATILRVLSEQLGHATEEITPDARLEDLGADSLDVVEIGQWLFDELGVEPSDDALFEAKTVQQLVDLYAPAKPSSAPPDERAHYRAEG